MAGSYRHCTTKDNATAPDFTFELIDNMGDAYEACEEMWHVIQVLAGGDQTEIERCVRYVCTRKQEDG